MGFRLVIVCIALFAITAHAQDFHQTALKFHNQYRKSHGSKPLSLDRSLNKKAASCAQYYLSIGQMDYSCKYKGDVGENIFSGSGNQGSNADIARTATQGWYSEVKDYRYNNPGYKPKTGHFSQLVWKASTQLGFGIASKNGNTYAVALYSPRGNFAMKGKEKETYTKNVGKKL